MANNTNIEQLFVGIDGGGTKCRATIYSSCSGVLGTGLGGPANPLHGLEVTLDSITTSTKLAMKEAGLKVETIQNLYAGLGLAGVNIPQMYSKIKQWQHPFKQLFLTTDLHAACIGAHNGGDGAVIITGTGSCGFSQFEGKTTTLGGHGFTLGDKGSGAWIGLEAVKAVLLEFDELAPHTILTAKLKQHFAVDNSMQIVAVMTGKPSSCYAQLAQYVFEAAEQNDAVARAILKEGADYISQLAQRLLKNNRMRISMIGGLAEPLKPWLDKATIQLIKAPQHPPEIGAIYFAQQELLKQQEVIA